MIHEKTIIDNNNVRFSNDLFFKYLLSRDTLESIKLRSSYLCVGRKPQSLSLPVDDYKYPSHEAVHPESAVPGL